ncbi:MAG TPA: DUF1801 domain-containing protein [Opitutaceae bacterium]|nr:DUF1801 domain-containing protein [Opitutaceae bacterium]
MKPDATAKNPKVEASIASEDNWHDEIRKLRSIVLECPLTEEVKWGKPCYTHEGHNIVLIHVFKAYAALLFFKGALLKDPEGLLVQQTENVQSGRQLRFTSVREIADRKAIIKDYIQEAIAVEQAGLKVTLKTTADYQVPPELKTRLDHQPALKKAFAALTPGRQRAYLFYFSGAKQSTTREARIAKYVPRILAGKGLNDE